jgi:hypothetical protein
MDIHRPAGIRPVFLYLTLYQKETGFLRVSSLIIYYGLVCYRLILLLNNFLNNVMYLLEPFFHSGKAVVFDF